MFEKKCQTLPNASAKDHCNENRVTDRQCRGAGVISGFCGRLGSRNVPFLAFCVLYPCLTKLQHPQAYMLPAPKLPPDPPSRPTKNSTQVQVDPLCLSPLQLALLICALGADSNRDVFPSTRTTKAETNLTSRLNALFSMYNEKAATEDRNMAESWKSDADGALLAVRSCFLYFPMDVH